MIGVGIIGLSQSGGWAATAHLPALRAIPGCEVRGLTASTLESARHSAEAHGVSWYSDDPEALARRQDIDLVVIAVRVPEHRRLVEAVASAGKPLYCEWPLGVNLGDARFITDLARRHGVRGFAGLQARALPVVRHVRELVQGGALGEILSTSMIAADGSAGGRVAPRYVYSLDRSQGVSTLTVAFGHAFDALCWCLGDFSRLSSVVETRVPTAMNTETGEVHVRTAPDQVAVAGVLQSGAVASLHYRGIRSTAMPFQWEINGTKGDLVVTANTGHMQFGGLRLMHSSKPGGVLQEVVPPGVFEAPTLQADNVSYGLAHAYQQVFNDLRNAERTAPTFEDAVVRHDQLALIERASVA